MGHYRNLTVDGEDYQFNIGKRFVGIKSANGTEYVPKEDIGFGNSFRIIVKPKMIADYIKGIRGNVEEYFPSCSCEGVEKSLGCKPFEAEIDGKIHHVLWCDECYHNSEMDI